VVELLAQIWKPSRIIIPRSVAVTGMRWENPCFEAEVRNNELVITPKVRNQHIDFMRLISPDYERQMTRGGWHYSSDDLVKNVRKYGFKPLHRDSEEVYADITEYPLRWAQMIKDFSNFPDMKLEIVSNPSPYIDVEEMTKLLEQIPWQILECIVNEVQNNRPNARLTVKSAPIAPKKYELDAEKNDDFYGLYGDNNGSWNTGNGRATVGTQYVLDQANHKFKSTGYYQTAYACEGGLEIFSYNWKNHGGFKWLSSPFGFYRGDCRYSDKYYTHNYHGKHIDFEELAVVYLAFNAAGADCSFERISSRSREVFPSSYGESN
jgi:hypothetical protein